MSKRINLDVVRFLVCSTGEDVLFAEPDDDLGAAINLRDEKQSDDTYETWSIVAELAC